MRRWDDPGQAGRRGCVLRSWQLCSRRGVDEARNSVLGGSAIIILFQGVVEHPLLLPARWGKSAIFVSHVADAKEYESDFGEEFKIHSLVAMVADCGTVRLEMICALVV